MEKVWYWYGVTKVGKARACTPLFSKNIELQQAPETPDLLFRIGFSIESLLSIKFAQCETFELAQQ